MGKKPKSYEDFKKSAKEDFDNFTKEMSSDFNDFMNNSQKEFDDFSKDSKEKFNNFTQKSVSSKIQGAKNRVAEHIGTDISAVCETLTKLHDFDLDSMKVTTIGKADNTEIVVACNNGIAIGKGDKFYVATPGGGMANLQEAPIYDEIDLNDPSKGYALGAIMGLTNKNVDVMDKTLDKMRVVYPAMGFHTKLNKALEVAYSEAHSYKMATMGIDPIEINNQQQKQY